MIIVSKPTWASFRRALVYALFWGAIGCFASGAAHAKDITVTLSDEEQNVVTQALDTYVKAGGLAVATNAALMLQKLVAAKNAPAATPAPVEEPKK